MKLSIRILLYLFTSLLLVQNYSYAEDASKIIVKNKDLGLSTTKRKLNLQNVLGRLHKPAEDYFPSASTSSAVASAGGETWSGVARAICFSSGVFTVIEHPTTVVFTATTGTGTMGTVTATSSFAGITGSSNLCTSAPSGVNSATYLVEGNIIYVGDGSSGFSVYDISIIDSTMTVTQGGSSWSWVLQKQ